MTIKGARLVMLGRQGSGKGTQCVRLSQHYVVPHISTGDMLRAAVREKSELGRQAKTVMDGGGLVGDEVMVGLVQARIDQDDARSRGYILDGFPRTVVQAVELDRITQDRGLDVVIDLVVPREIVLTRITARRVCRDCGTNYTVGSVDRRPWLCDNCGGDVVQRDDDTPEAINRRLDLYESQTAPLIEFYGRTSRLVEVNGVGTPDQVFQRLTTTIDARL